MAFDLSFLPGITYVQMVLDFEVADPVTIPGFAGSSFRGALGDVFRPALCCRRPTCAARCESPETCPCYSLFERDRDSTGRFSRNAPKAMILEPVVPLGLDQIAHGRAVEPPYRLDRGHPPVVSNASSWTATEGHRLPLLMTLLGPVAALAPAVVEALRVAPFSAMGGRLWLARALDGSTAGRTLFDAAYPAYGVQPPAIRSLGWPGGEPFSGRARVVLTTPTRQMRDGGLAVDAIPLAVSFPRDCLVRAIRVHDALGPPGRERLPWMDVPSVFRAVEHRLALYAWQRVSHRQQRWLVHGEFDGMIGYFDLEGEWSADLIRLMLAVEVLHVGQKASFGLGRVRWHRL